MEKQNYYVGLDIGTDSVGYAVTDEAYRLGKFKGEPMWGVTLFEEAKLAVERRSFRVARRRLDRRQQRVRLIADLFAPEIVQIDRDFFARIKGSYLYRENKEDAIRLFGSYAEQKAYETRFPTIHHLLSELMNSTEPHDVRLLYTACAWLVAHRGHFLNEVDKHSIDKVLAFQGVYQKLVDFLTEGDAPLPWHADVDLKALEHALREKCGITKKTKRLAEILFLGKAPKVIDDLHAYNYELVLKLLCGGKVSLKDLFGRQEYADLEEKSVALNMDDEKLAAIMQTIDEDAELISVLKAIYDWSVLVDVLKGEKTISEAKVRVYEQHKRDLRFLKGFVKKYLPQKYNDIFRSDSVKGNYVSYSYCTKSCSSGSDVKKADKETFSKYLLSVVKNVPVEACDATAYCDMIARLEELSFLPKQVDGDNRVIPYQLYWYELNRILENAKGYMPFLRSADEDGITGAEKILSVFEFRVPYFVGPLRTNDQNDRRKNHWMVRKAEGKIYPWNFSQKVDLDASEEAFIARMTNTCTYLPGEDVLPKNSLCYSAFQVLNEINNIKINGADISVELKQRIYNDVFMRTAKVTPKRLRQYLLANHWIGAEDVISGIDETIRSTLKPFLQFESLIKRGCLTHAQAEEIILRATYSEDKGRYVRWLKEKFPHLSEADIRYLANQKWKDFGRLSARFLCGIEGSDKNTGETFTLIRALWETNCNLMQLLSDRFTFADQVENAAREYYDANPKSFSQRLDDMHLSNAVKRPIIRAWDILQDIVKIKKGAPSRIFVEMARGGSEEQKGKRTISRLQQLRELYEKVDTEDVRILNQQLDDMGDMVHNMLQSDKLFLYFIQLGKCLYTGRPIDLNSVIAGDGVYNVEHIYPRSFVKDDSILNNKILVDSKANGDKGDTFPISPIIQEKMYGYWRYLHAIGLIGDEKFKRLTRKTHFTEEERYEFINRQLVETRQSTKVIATLLKDWYPDSEVVYVKAGLVSDFRQAFDLPKSRQINDLHHAKDAYLNIVVGNVWHSKFSRRYYQPQADNNVKVEVLFGHPVRCRQTVVWNGGEDIARIKNVVRKNTAHLTRYAFCRKGGFFDQMPLPAPQGQVPRKKDMPIEIYGGYNKSTATFFVLVKYQTGKKQDVMVMPVELLYAKEFLADPAFAKQYALQTVGNIINKPVDRIEFLLDGRILKINTMLSLDGLRACITGKSGGGKALGMMMMGVFMTSAANEAYIKKLESFARKKAKNANLLADARHDGITEENNLLLYDCYIDKFQKWPYNKRPANPVEALIRGREAFAALHVTDQATILLQLLGLFGRINKADLSMIHGVPSAGVATLSSCLSNWKKAYSDVRIIDSSASGMFESYSDNLLELV